MSAENFSRCMCPHCNGHIEFPDEAMGAVVACPHCQMAVTLSPDDSPFAAEEPLPTAELTPTTIAAAFQGAVPKTRTSILYQFGLIIVAITMIILPFIYLALVSAAGWCVYWWATHGTFLFTGTGGGGRGMILKLMVYLAPLFTGIVVVFFMIKPLLARRAPAATPLALNPAAEPALFALVQCVCDAVGAPFPKRIDADCNLNASASFRRGMLSFFGNDLVLTIGMPLVAGMNTRQFAGILAHEFGHFTQGFGMRLSYIIRSITFWFTRVAYERDAWDVMLEQWSAEAEDARIAIIVAIAQFGVWISRLVLKLLLLIGTAIGCFLLRQMEFDADSYEIKLAGSETFESSTKQLHVLSEATGKAYKGLDAGWKTAKRLPDDFPAYMLAHFHSMPSASRTQLEDAAGLEKTGLFDSHPAAGDRIREARKAGEPGIFDLDAPATALFTNFEVIAKQVTQLHYAEDLGIELSMAKLSPVVPSPTSAA